jgi:hypothetical protein
MTSIYKWKTDKTVEYNCIEARQTKLMLTRHHRNNIATSISKKNFNTSSVIGLKHVKYCSIVSSLSATISHKLQAAQSLL